MAAAVLVLPLPTVGPINDSHKLLVKQAVEESLRLKLDKLIVLVQFPNKLSVDGQWHELQSALCSIYVTQLNVAYASDAPLFNCTVVIDEWCNYSVGLEPELTDAFVAEQGI